MQSNLIEEAYSYELPEERIAQRPVVPYDSAKLLLADRSSGALENSTFSKLAEFLMPSDLLVFNNSKVIPARLFGKFQDSGAAVEIILHRRKSKTIWRCLGKPLKKCKEGRILEFSAGLKGRVMERPAAKEVLLEIFSDNKTLDPNELVLKAGTMPIPPYIRNGRGDKQDRIDYQSIFASHDGSVAAPTASLHFTESLMSNISAKGCQTDTVTLHVGAASFLPLWNDDAEGGTYQAPGGEAYVYSTGLIEKIRGVKGAGGRVIAVGTTVVRALETMGRSENQLEDGLLQETELFIKPGHDFLVVDGVVTNFHQPRTTHMLLVQALMGRELLEKSYSYALANDYRFLSYGDGMFITGVKGKD